MPLRTEYEVGNIMHRSGGQKLSKEKAQTKRNHSAVSYNPECYQWMLPRVVKADDWEYAAIICGWRRKKGIIIFVQTRRQCRIYVISRSNSRCTMIWNSERRRRCTNRHLQRRHIYYLAQQTPVSRYERILRVPRRGGIDEFDVVGGEKAEIATGTHALPPAFVDLLDIRDDLRGVERNFGVVAGLVVVESAGAQAVLRQ
jgi:hypothetical protein